MNACVNVYELWEAEASLCPLSEKQTNLIQSLESLGSAAKLPEEDNVKVEDSEDLSRLSLTADVDDGDSLSQFPSLKRSYEACKQLSQTVDNILDNLFYLKKLYDTSMSKSFSVHSSCTELHGQEQNLIVAYEAVEEKLKYFREAKALEKKLGSPTVLTLNESLMPSLARVQDCMNFFLSKPNYKDCAFYGEKIKSLENQTLQFVAKHVVNSIQNSCKQVMPESGQPLSASDNVFTLFYARFQATSQRIKSLMLLIENRIDSHPEYQEYLDDCHETFFKARETLIVPVLTLAIEDMVSQHGKSYCALTRNSCRMLVHICKDEYTLFTQFFNKPSRRLAEFLELLCTYLYNVLRPIVIHINHLETLSELCCIVKQEVLEDLVVNDATEMINFGRTMHQLVADIQERLVYRTNIYIQTSIVQYSPAPGDLAYPEKLEMMENIADMVSVSNLTRSDSLTSVASTAISDVSFAMHNESYSDYRGNNNSKSPADLYGMWYPTVRRTIMCLSKLYRSLERDAFLGLAQDVVSGCLESLKKASEEIIKTKSIPDGQLFLIKHLLIVREQIAPFKIECTMREVELDFTKIRNAAINLFQNGKNIFSLKSNNGLLQFLFEFPVSILTVLL